MKSLFFSVLLILLVSNNLQAQSDTTSQADLNIEISQPAKDSVVLLPNRMLITQRLLWGKSGLMRNLSAFELNRPNRIKEMKIRRTMIVSHEVIGYATIAGMIANGYVGARLYSDRNNENLHDAHEVLSAAVNIGYFASASLAVFAPPKFRDAKKGYSKLKLHKALTILHLSTMIATNILSGMLEDNPGLRPYHRATAFVALGSFAVSIVVIEL